ncbi:hypothetical protein DERF_004643 [Dermatophagoides farinae]|uniref:Uncharacterized protein n=1 Tax=Dermatophagoides farinae TaxID=6954 RepID=A0A922I7S2_DERFA|nr:hypothetical protein DERF_004643 [Dermatophagoides farinae]
MSDKFRYSLYRIQQHLIDQRFGTSSSSIADFYYHQMMIYTFIILDSDDDEPTNQDNQQQNENWFGLALKSQRFSSALLL